ERPSPARSRGIPPRHRDLSEVLRRLGGKGNDRAAPRTAAGSRGLVPPIDCRRAEVRERFLPAGRRARDARRPGRGGTDVRRGSREEPEGDPARVSAGGTPTPPGTTAGRT